ncbi:MAG: indolepyruvate ferredoxin oxidoreductase, partial [Anaerolineales bacterium]
MKVLLSGNEAIARGAYEYGVKVATGYPGTPSSEILENVAKYSEIYSEWSVNEKVAMDVAIGAAYAGQRTMVVMKSVGMNVAADSFFYAVYTGLNGGGLLIVTADDPGMFSSQNEQDNRHYARFAKMPMLEPSDSQEAKDFVGIGLGLSEEWDTPVLLRTVMRISHSASPVELGERTADDTEPTPPLERNPHKLVSTCLWARERHPVVEARLKKLAELASGFPFNRLEWGDRKLAPPQAGLGIVASGPVYHYAREIFPEVSFLKLGMTYPLPSALIQEFAAGVEQLLIIEELDPFLEEQIKVMGIACRGKEIFPACGELTTAVIGSSAAEAGILPREAVKAARQVAPLDLPGRSPVLCPGCPHRSTFYVLSKMKQVVVAGDIGCYNLGALPPFNATDTMGAMGASVGVAHGFDVAGIPDPFVAVIGDSTFFHAGIAPLLDIVHNGGKSTVVILDNHTTAMTGHQDHPGVAVRLGGQPARKVDIEAIVRASGVTDVHKVDAFDVKAGGRALEEALAFDGP